MKKRYAEARETVDEMSVYREKYELSKRQIDKLVNERPAKSAENTITKLMAGKFDLSTKEKQDLLQDFLKMFYNEDGSLNEGALFDMFLVNKKLHENLSKTRDTVSYVSIVIACAYLLVVARSIIRGSEEEQSSFAKFCKKSTSV